jgi:DDE superfamily endonuclease
VAAVEAVHPLAEVELWTMDEHRLGLKPVLRRVWARRGHRPVVRVYHRFQWLYVYCFVRPTTGESCWLLLPTVNAATFSVALALFAAQVGAGPHKRVLLVLDQAGYHTSQAVVVPEGIHLEWLPSSSPELQPAERLWPLTNERIANRLFADLDELEAALAQRCLYLAQQPTLLRAHTQFHWWPAA